MEVFLFCYQLARGWEQLSWLVKMKHLFQRISFSKVLNYLIFKQYWPLPMQINTFSKICREVLFTVWLKIVIFSFSVFCQIGDAGFNYLLRTLRGNARICQCGLSVIVIFTNIDFYQTKQFKHMILINLGIELYCGCRFCKTNGFEFTVFKQGRYLFCYSLDRFCFWIADVNSKWNLKKGRSHLTPCKTRHSFPW